MLSPIRVAKIVKCALLEIILLIVPIPTLLLKIVTPDTFNDDLHVVALFNVALPDIFNVDENVAGVL